jgi:c-di-GMP-binding flagellar brake protein YcgR
MDAGNDISQDLFERRAYVRIRRELHGKCLPARNQSSKDMLSARTLEIGIGGARLALRRELPEGAEVELTIDDPAAEHFVARANVAWTRWSERRQHFETGMEFLDQTADQRAAQRSAS